MTRARDNADLGDSYGALGAGVTGGSGLTALASNVDLSEIHCSTMFDLDTTHTGDAYVSGWSKMDTTGLGGAGSSVTTSGNNFLFPTTGVYKVDSVFKITNVVGNQDNQCNVQTIVSIDAGSTDNHKFMGTVSWNQDPIESGGAYKSVSTSFLVNCSDTTNIVVKVTTASFGSASLAHGDAATPATWISFTRISNHRT